MTLASPTRALRFQLMSPNPTRRLGPLAALVATLALSGCAAFASQWPGPVPIDPELWEVEIDWCDHREGFEFAWLEGRVINPTDEPSPYYDVAYTVTYDDGHQVYVDGNTSIPPLEPGESGDFLAGILDSEGRTIASCEVIVTDSVSNYTS